MSQFQQYLQDFKEFGVVKEVYHPMIVVEGLPGVKPREIVVFENGMRGEVLEMDGDLVRVQSFSRFPIQVGLRVARTQRQLFIPVGDHVLGKMLNPLGEVILSISKQNLADTKQTEVSKAELLLQKQQLESKGREIDIPPLSIAHRQEITQQFVTGVAMVDVLLPLGQGQRELVVGDRKTGKSSFLKSVIKSHVRQGGIAIYAAVGKRSIEIEGMRDFIIQQKLYDQVVMVVTTSQDSPSMIHIAPFAAMTLAEYFRDQGRSVVVVLDDLTTHAKYYREVSLLAKRFPGRDSYPGDVFYTHARLLERAGNFVIDGKKAAITCLPVAETTENDLTDYIVSNLIGITDGHILFDHTEFIKGRRPAINPMLSVTRVGKQTQTPLEQDLTQQLTLFISRYLRSITYSHFGSELSAEVRKLLHLGQLVYQFFTQQPQQVYAKQVQVLLLAVLFAEVYPEIDSQQIEQCKRQYQRMFADQNAEIIKLYQQLTEGVKTWREFLDKVAQQAEAIIKLCPHANK